MWSRGYCYIPQAGPTSTTPFRSLPTAILLVDAVSTEFSSRKTPSCFFRVMRNGVPVCKRRPDGRAGVFGETYIDGAGQDSCSRIATATIAKATLTCLALNTRDTPTSAKSVMAQAPRLNARNGYNEPRARIQLRICNAKVWQ